MLTSFLTSEHFPHKVDVSLNFRILCTVGGVGARADWLIAEQVFAVQRAAELLQEAQHVVDAVHHREAEQVLLPVKRGCKQTNTVNNISFKHTN